jgi:hypothetical protein
MTRLLAALLVSVTLALGTYYAANAQQLGGRYFGGYPCTLDCIDHSAGYRWAAQHHVTRADDCTGEPRSFREGCRAFVRNRLRGAAYDDDGKPIR